ncbi:bifunctional folylpolyglutamate synthase/dihydrofolate synthase [Sphingobacterium sp. lm-10]|uniref:bifunctional folylpolyglutamate synthase/dihydrofolate synthase n=1 Tax=Sphingobacterium sp. lm-10 TaxID=2944904 RepID=UPI002020908D|nr:folylpolyglutamate synthase/dihydrofolate synthase family protein [Sphingobacterium sp. lm-10]MCL7989158.1 bifunctional folylpolyglutamate synthase/dihydrofolate synthase [Sphingobacterium sp. lm-10]
MNNYTEAIEYLYARLPMFTRDGASAINKGLDRTIQLCEYLGNPQQHFKAIHVAGTNGKGSSSHMITSILEVAGLKTGLYTSPHLVDFRERIRVHGLPVGQDYVLRFIQQHQAFIEEIQPSFFEVTVGMAFDYFAQQKVDVAIIEVGLGGRLDSTNIITPILSLITNIGLDHMDMLGDTIPAIAAEKAGIIKQNTPIVISEYQIETEAVFRNQANVMHAPITFASEQWNIQPTKDDISPYQALEAVNLIDSSQSMDLQLDLMGSYQANNVRGVLCVIDQLRLQGWTISDEHIRLGLQQVQQRTGLMGRWQTIATAPWVICDTGHNEDGIRQVVQNLKRTPHRNLHIVIGAMKDKDLSHILPLLPKTAYYHFCAPALPRAMHASALQELASQYGLTGQHYPSVLQAYQAALNAWQPEDLVFVGGSTFVVAEVLTSLQVK